MTLEIGRRLVDGVWVTDVADESGGGGGLPAGGTTGEVLTKVSDADGDADWEAGGGAAFTGWTADEADPANVNANGGGLEVGTFVSSTVDTGLITMGEGFPRISRGSGAPTAGVPGVPGSLYLRTNGQVWIKTGVPDGEWTQIGGVPAAAIKTVRVPVAFDDTPVTPFTAYTPAAGEAILWNMSYLSVSEAFDGNNPTLELTFSDFAGVFNSFSLGSTDGASSDGHTLTPISTLDLSSNIGIFPDTDPLLAILDDGANGDPNDPTPMTVGAAELVLVIVGV